MKKVLLLLAMSFLLAPTFVSCTPEKQLNEEYQTDPNENCPPSDKNCNGIPDTEENN
jgi:hypothetical protein